MTPLPVRPRPALFLFLCCAIAYGPLGCGFAHLNQEQAQRPERAGDPAPSLASYDPHGTGSGSSDGSGTQSSNSGPRSSSGSSSGNGAPGGSDLTMISGSKEDNDSEYKLRDAPLGPLAVLFGYPFWIFGKTLGEEADQAVDERKLPSAEPDLPERSAHPQDVVQRRATERENAELADQLRRSASHSASRDPSAAGPSTIGDELAALQRSLGQGGAIRGSTRAAPRAHVDRDADGRSDLWTERNADGTQRESLDEDGDGRVDRALTYDAEHRLIEAREDRDGDGKLETVTYYEGGAPTRREADLDGDGRVDSWTRFERGEMVRHQLDRDGDGLADLSLVYVTGELVREEEDRNGDGRADLISYYRNGEVVERAEDTDYDGEPDLRSFFEHGRLVRREVG